MAKNKEKYSMFYALSLSKKELARQVRDYDKLKFYQSARGVPVLMLIATFVISLLLLTQLTPGIFNPLQIIFGMIIYAPFLFFTSRGHRWAIIVLIILYTYDKWYVFALVSGISALSTWLLICAYLYRALKVENERKNKSH